jgi:hypothetical protein
LVIDPLSVDDMVHDMPHDMPHDMVHDMVHDMPHDMVNDMLRDTGGDMLHRSSVTCSRSCLMLLRHWH